ncbi:uncharacterized protein LOC117296972 [Asterias rubens]|uniref:uncharacterized protein LOC117296972 n=1 Tax=Asterias rubens TaxID=7604 RepID=UPI00145522C5|nr:uncharacterized protein LOC117296972 [Asterias rubens]
MRLYWYAIIAASVLVLVQGTPGNGAMVQHPGLCPDWDDPVYDGVLQVGNCPNDCRKSLNDYDCKDTERCCPTPCSAYSWMCVPPSIKVMFKPPPWAKTTPQPRPETTPQPQPITETTLQPTFGCPPFTDPVFESILSNPLHCPEKCRMEIRNYVKRWTPRDVAPTQAAK